MSKKKNETKCQGGHEKEVEKSFDDAYVHESSSWKTFENPEATKNVIGSSENRIRPESKKKNEAKCQDGHENRVEEVDGTHLTKEIVVNYNIKIKFRMLDFEEVSLNRRRT